MGAPRRGGFYFVGGRQAVDFLNTRPAVTGAPELLVAAADVRAFARAAGVEEGAEARPGDVVRLRRFRERLRVLLDGWRRGALRRADVAVINRHLERAPEVLELALHGKRLVRRRRTAGGSLVRLRGLVARSAAELLMDGEPGRYRKCANPTCGLWFYDDSKAGRRRWCSMQLCGGRAKWRAFARRRKR